MLGWLGLLCCLAYLFGHLWVRLRCLEVRSVDDFEPPACDPAKRLSVVVAARNEEDTIVPALQRLLSHSDPQREIIIVEDRSEDRTRELVAKLCAEHSELRMVVIEELPEGWLGKVHALHRGAQEAQGEWLLFSDADVHMDGAVVRKCVNLCEAQKLDHLAVLPKLESRTFLARCTIAAFCGMLLTTTTRKRRQDATDRTHAIGVGAFNLVRREVLERSEGFDWLRMDVADDMALALVLKRAGARHDIMFNRDGLAVEWYPTLPAMVHGLEKNAFGVACHYSVMRSLVTVMVCLNASVGPLLALGSHPEVVLLTYAVGGFSSYVSARQMGWRGIAPIFVPLGTLFIGWIVANSAAKTLWRGGVEWRGTRYSLSELREQQRIRF
ncbi:MAG: glycosyltransferase [Myxococcota bacterium]|nr:glycosyltransferase [Myxococcota bacterium]